eukprot:m.261047 g.261047  ORF g.261047 m.261047 type:complete len:85 (+) comp15570_c0_seq3:210-464(+)
MHTVSLCISHFTLSLSPTCAKLYQLLKGAKGDSVQVKEVQRAMQGQRFKGAVRSIMVLKRVGSNLSSPDSPAGDSTGSAACTVM